tara:strand:+ start:900 stop:1196 length:297 start_codon:yes stop_codon:yes gene_type:complete
MRGGVEVEKKLSHNIYVNTETESPQFSDTLNDDDDTIIKAGTPGIGTQKEGNEYIVTFTKTYDILPYDGTRRLVEETLPDDVVPIDILLKLVNDEWAM